MPTIQRMPESVARNDREAKRTARAILTGLAACLVLCIWAGTSLVLTWENQQVEKSWAVRVSEELGRSSVAQDELESHTSSLKLALASESKTWVASELSELEEASTKAAQALENLSREGMVSGTQAVDRALVQLSAFQKELDQLKSVPLNSEQLQSKAAALSATAIELRSSLSSLDDSFSMSVDASSEGRSKERIYLLFSLGGGVLILMAGATLAVLARLQRGYAESVSEKADLVEQNAALAETTEELQREKELLLQHQKELEQSRQEIQDALEHAEIQTAMHDHASRRFQSLFEGLPVGCMTFDGDGTVFEWNQRMSDIIGQPRHLALLNPITSALKGFGQEDLLLDTLRRTVQDGEKVTLEYSFETGTGPRVAEFVFFPLNDHRGVIVGGIACALDVTEEIARQKQIESMARFQSVVLDSTEYAMITCDIGGVITGFNSAAEKLLQYDAREVLGEKPIADLHLETELELWAAELAEATGNEQISAFEALVHHANQGEASDVEWQYVRKDGSTFDAEVMITALRDEHGEVTGYLAVAKDVTQEKANAERLVTLSLVAQEAANGVVIMDASGHALFVNPAFAKISGYTSDEILGQAPYSLRQSESTDEAVFASLTKAIRAQSPFDGDLEFLRPDGTSYWVRLALSVSRDELGVCSHLIAIEEDITERKNAEFKILASEQRFRDVVEAAGEYIWEVDTEFRYTYVSDQVTDVSGYLVEELLGRNMLDMVAKPDIRKAQNAVAEAMLAGKGFSNLVFQSLHKDGHIIWERVNALPIRDAHGEVIGFRGTGLDITLQKVAEDNLAAAKERISGILESIQDRFYSLNKNRKFTYANGSSAEGYGMEPEQLLGKHIKELHPEEYWSVLWDVFDQVQKTGEPSDLEMYHPPSDTWLEFRVYPGQNGGISVFYQDITERKLILGKIEEQMARLNEANLHMEIQQMQLEDANAKLRNLASTDGLTGLKNHKTFQEYLHDQYHAAETVGLELGVILLDVDKFKQYNDGFGHLAGDEVLKGVARILREAVPEPHLPARYGGEEFVIVTVGLNEAETWELAEEVRMRLEEHDWPHREVTGSFGVSMFGPHVESRQHLIDLADKALYASKEGGRNRVTLSSDLRKAA